MTSRILSLSLASLLVAATAVPAVAAPVADANLGAYCRGEAAKAFNARPTYVKSIRPAHAADGSATVDGTYEDEDGHTKSFQCHYDAKLNFVDVKAVAAAKTK